MQKLRDILLALGVIALAANASSAMATTITFEGIAATNSYQDFELGPLTLSGASFTGDGGNIFVIDQGFYGYPYPGAFLNMSFSTNTLTINLPGGIHSIAFDFGALFSAASVGAPVGTTVSAEVSLNGGPATTISTADSIEDGALHKFFFSSASAISTVTLTLPDFPQYNAIDNFSFTAAIPEPSTWAMMILGFAGVGFMAYRRKSKQVLLPT